MLTNLYIENIAVIEKTSIDFTEGLNVMTGETGAGKSIVIDSINAVLGNRTPRDLIRSGADTALVCAEFTDPSQKAVDALREYGFDTDDGSVILQRELNTSGKGKCRINGRPASVSILKEVGAYLINIHGQHESYELMSPDLHITYIDKLGNLHDDVEAYREVFQRYKSLRAELNKAQLDDSERARKIDLLTYQINELEEAELYVGEYEELTEQRNLLENRERIAEALNETREALNGGEDTDGAVQALEQACSALSNITDFLPEADALLQRLQSAAYELEDCAGEVTGLLDDSESDEYSLEEIEDRLDLIRRLGRKYGVTIEEMLAFLENARKELDTLERYAENREALEADCQAALRQAKILAKNLSDRRREISVQFSSAVREEMTFLDMPNVQLVIRQESCELNSFGCDDMEILISTNPGEAPKPVSKIASGGELSRMMLAIKNVLADKDDIDTLIFDEVDTGISGSAAQKVGLKLREVSKSRQVLCVTHLAQIAALANGHYKIHKDVADGKTYTSVDKLDRTGRIGELARIIGGVEITQATLDYAAEMLKNGAQ